MLGVQCETQVNDLGNDGANAVLEVSAAGGSAYGGNVSYQVTGAWVNAPGLDQPIERIAFINGEARQRQVFHADGLGSIAALTDESGEPAQTYTYAAFGSIRTQTGTDLNRVTYTDREAMGDSLGFYYYRHRIYDPHTGRFTSEDPLGFVDGVNRYVYCANNPVNWTDTFGLEVNMYSHVVFWPAYHSNLRLYPDDPSVVTRMGYALKGGECNSRQYVALGAGRVNGVVQSDENRPRDVATWPQHYLGQVQPPDGMSNDDYIQTLLRADRNFLDNLDYDLFPAALPGQGWNSNGYIHGLINATGGTAPSTGWPPLPGWNNPIAPENFQ